MSSKILLSIANDLREAEEDDRDFLVCIENEDGTMAISGRADEEDTAVRFLEMATGAVLSIAERIASGEPLDDEKGGG